MSPLSPQEIRAAAEAHRELGPEYHDAVVESFLAKVEKQIETRIEARLADPPPARRRQLEPATLANRRSAQAHPYCSLVDLVCCGLRGRCVSPSAAAA
jgi:hypothetical protein